MNPWPFVIGAYALTLGGALILSVASLVAMKRGEKRADELTKRS